MAYGPSRSRSKSLRESRSPNLIPIMNLFIVIIPMLMTIMISVRLAMIEITLPSQGGTQEAVEEPPKTLTLILYPDRFEIKVEKKNDLIKIPMLADSTYDYVELDKEIAKLKAENPSQFVMEILPDPNVKFDTLLRSIDICKTNDFPNIKYLTTKTKFYKAR